MIQIKGLQIAYCLTEKVSEEEEGFQQLIKITENSNYRGCDIFLSLLWPYHLLHSSQPLPPSSLSHHEGSLQVSILANKLCPRYHFTCGQQFLNRPPYLNQNSHETTLPYTRFISLANVTSSKEKHLKWLHALSLEPLSRMSEQEIQSSNAAMADVTPNPYIPYDQSLIQEMEPPSKRSRFEALVSKERAVQSSVFYDMAPTESQAEAQHDPPPKRPSYIAADDGMTITGVGSTTLFIGGFAPKTRTEELETFLSTYGCAELRRNEGKGFAFATFQTAEAARALIDSPEGIRFKGRQLIINWKKERAEEVASAPPSSTHSLVYFGGVPNIASTEDLLEQLDFVIHEKDVKSVRRPEGKNFLFIEFASHELASKVVETSGKTGIFKQFSYLSVDRD